MKPGKTAFKKSGKAFLIILGSLLALALAIYGAGAIFLSHLQKDPDLSNLQSYHPFKSEQAQEEYLRYYDARSKQWPVPSETRFVETTYGRTFVRISGPVHAPALVLLPCVSSPMFVWIPNIRTLSGKYRVYAVDNIYDFGRSIFTKVMHRPDEMVAWLDELLLGLGLRSGVNLIGYSFGGWLTSQYALRHPERLNSIVMVAPAATIIPLPPSWAVHGLIAAIPSRLTMNSMFKWAMPYLLAKKDQTSRQLIENIRNDGLMGLRSFTFKMPVAPTVLSDDELRNLRTPALFLVGEKEVIYDSHEAVARLNKVAPWIKTEIIPDASHDLPLTQNDLMSKKVIEFLSR